VVAGAQKKHMAHMAHMAHNCRIAAMVRPCKPDTKELRRPLTAAQRAIIRAAGAGDLSRGFNELLAIYHHLHMMGYRPGMRPQNIRIVQNDGE